MWTAAILTPPAGADEADRGAQLAPIGWIKRSKAGTDWHELQTRTENLPAESGRVEQHGYKNRTQMRVGLPRIGRQGCAAPLRRLDDLDGPVRSGTAAALTMLASNKVDRCRSAAAQATAQGSDDIFEPPIPIAAQQT